MSCPPAVAMGILPDVVGDDDDDDDDDDEGEDGVGEKEPPKPDEASS